MGMVRELKLRARQIIGPVIGMSVVVYFTYHVVQGDRGLLALGTLLGEVNALQAQVLDVRSERFALENKVKMLRVESLDPDLLEERARAVLGYGNADELVVVPDQDPPSVKALAAFKP